MSAIAILNDLRRRGVRLRATSGRLHVDDPKGIMTAALRAELAVHENELLELLAESTWESLATPSLVPVSRDGDFPLSFAQERLWFLDQMGVGSAYNISVTQRFEGQLDVGAFERTLHEIVRRHEILRTTFPVVDGQPVQRIAETTDVPFSTIDLSNLDTEAASTELARRRHEEGLRSFDLARGPLLRWQLLRMGDGDHVLLLTMHHIVSDGWSMGVLNREFAVLYGGQIEGRPVSLPELPVQYADYTCWQRSRLQSESLERELSYWRQRLGDGPPPLDFPTDRPRPRSPSYRGDAVTMELPAQVLESLRALSRSENATLFMVLVAAFKVLLMRYSSQEDILIGMPIAGRHHRKVEGLIGCFLNTLVLRTDLSGSPSFREVLRRVRRGALEAYGHQDIPFEKLLEALQPERDLSRSPLFQVFCNMVDLSALRLELPGLEVQSVDGAVETEKFDLTLYLYEIDHRLEVRLNYSTDLFDRPTIELMLGNYGTLLETVTRDAGRPVGRLPLLSPEQRRRFAGARNRVSPATAHVRFPAAETEQTIAERFVKQVARTPDRPAVKTRDEEWTYGQLDAISNQVGWALREQVGSGHGHRIALLFDAGTPMVAGLLGTLRCGQAYVPLDPTYPAARLRLMLDDAGVRAIVTERRYLEQARSLADGRMAVVDVESLEGSPRDPVPSSAGPDSLAYILYTSGTRGRPKGVMQSHRNVLGHVRAYTNALRIVPEDRLTVMSSYTFDGAVMDLYGALLNGATLLPASIREESLGEMIGWLEEQKVTIYHSTPSVFRFIAGGLEAGQRLVAVRAVVLGGEEARGEDVALFRAHFGQTCVLVNGLGPSESTLALQYFMASDAAFERLRVPVGYPVEGTRVVLLDSAGEPTDVLGEIGIESRYVALGYWGLPVETASSFGPSISGSEHARLYRTGDLGRLRADGTLEFLGRLDHQVKVRGYRIEPGEIESVVLEHPEIRQALAVAREDAPGDSRLVAYVVAEEGRSPSDSDLRGLLKERLPEYMVPSAIVMLEAMPLTPNGKVDRQALPAPDWSAEAVSFVAARNGTEEVLCAIWSDVLGVDRVGVHDNFFELGGHSLLATQLTSRIRGTLEIEVPPRDLFIAPTVGELAKRIRSTRARPATPPLVRCDRDGDLPLSFTQERMWFLDRMGGGTAYKTRMAVRMSGKLDVPALERSLTFIVQRHEALRTTFPTVEGRPVQRVAPAADVRLPVIDLSDLPASGREEGIRRRVKESDSHRFDLERGPLIRPTLYRLGPPEHVLLIAMHHIISDGWSRGVLEKELSEAYDAFTGGVTPNLPDLPIQYADFTLWQRSWLTGEVLKEQLSYWRRRLGDGPAPLDLPTDRPRPRSQSYRGDAVTMDLSAPVLESLRALSRSENATPFMVLVAAFKVLLMRYSSREDISIGIPIAGRHHREIEGLIGCFLNTLVLRTDLSGSPSFREVLRRVRRGALEAYDHQDIPFEKLLEELQPQRDLSRSPLFQVFCNMVDLSASRLELPGLEVQSVDRAVETAKFDLTLYLFELDHRLEVRLNYSTDLFDRRTVELMLSNYGTLLEAVTEDSGQPVGRLPLLSPEQRGRFAGERNRVSPAIAHERFPAEETEQTIVERFAKQVARAPDRPAVKTRDEEWTYGQLDAISNRVGWALREHVGSGHGHRIALLFDMGAPMVAGLLGTLRCGQAYVPLDPTYPEVRLRLMLDDARVRAIVTERRYLEQARTLAGGRMAVIEVESPGGSPRDPVPSSAGPDSLAYIRYTSGTTGRPKGVMQSHRNVLAQVRAYTNALHIAPEDRLTLMSSYTFDAAVMDIYGALLNGATLCAMPVRELSLTNLEAWLCSEGVTVYHSTPSTFRYVFGGSGSGESLAGVRLVVFGGEEVLPDDIALVRRYFSGGCLLADLYGMSESSLATLYFMDAGSEFKARRVPIGYPVEGTRFVLLDSAGEPTDVLGEIGIESRHVALGYWGLPVETASSFGPSISGSEHARLYRTGDLGRLRADGTLEFLGRLDHQVKVRGYRIEPGEIESVVLEHSEIRQAVAVAREDAPGDSRLVAYVVAEGGRSPRDSDLRGLLKERLPEYMVPSAIVMLEAMPLTPNGKVDRQALPAPDWSAEAVSFVAARNGTEEVLCAIWSDVLGVDRVGVHDNFFELGGHSLLATQLTSRIRGTLEIEVPLRDLFIAPTVGELAKRIRSTGARPATPPLVRFDRHSDLPLSFAQQRLWFLDQMGVGTAYNMPMALRLRGRLDVGRLERALQEMVRRHETLRTNFPVADDQPVQRIAEDLGFQLSRLDLRALGAEDRDSEVRRLAQEEAGRPFYLATGPLLRGVLLWLGDVEHVLLLTMHHIVSDGWSMGVLLRELTTLYEACSQGKTSPLAELEIQYGDFTLWQRSWLAGEVLEEQLSYWREQLADTPTLDLPTDRRRPAVQTFNGASYGFEIPSELCEALNRLSRQERLTRAMVLLAGLQVLLSRYSGQEDIAVGSPIANRTHDALEPLIGFFVNTLVMRTDLSGDPSVREVLRRVQEVSLSAWEHQDVPFEQVVDALNPQRGLSRPPLFQVIFAMQNAPREDLRLGELEIERLPLRTTKTRFDIELYFFEHADRMVGRIVYNADLFEAATIERMAAHLERLLAGMAEDPSRRIADLPLLSEAERHEIVESWNETETPYPRASCVHALFEDQAARSPEAVAVEFGAETLTYSELNRRANRVAHHLIRYGVGPEVKVGVALERSVEMVVGILGILKAGGAYVPLATDYPAKRLAVMLEDTGAPVVLIQSHLRAILPRTGAELIELDGDWTAIAQHPAENPANRASADGLAYVMYTSGSTGSPKGTAVVHRGIVRLVRETNYMSFGPDEVFLQLAPISFDASTLELWGPLLNGGKVLLYPPGRLSLNELATAIRDGGVTSLWLTAALFPEMVDAELGSLCGVRQLLSGGDVLSVPHVKRVLEALPPGGRLINGYGPTENTTFTCCHVMEGGDEIGATVPIGRPIANTRVYVVDRHLHPVPAGVDGELLIGGDGLSRGYGNDPALTAERFIPDPFGAPGDRVYRTGDVARWRADGSIEFRGRGDYQVKVRGFRIELGEIESVLNRHDAVSAAVVTIRDEDRDKQLVAYVVPALDLDASETQHESADRVEQWRNVYEDVIYRGIDSESFTADDPGFNIVGWKSTYTEEPVGADAMREQVNQAVARMRAGRHDRVLEIGVGTGLLLFPVAPDCRQYWATDFSSSALGYVERNLDLLGERRNVVRLSHRGADDFEGVGAEAFDLVVLNSVIQYFPTVEYLDEVLRGAIRAVAPGGRVLIGDVRNLPLLEMFHSSVQRFQARPDLTVAQLKQRVQQQLIHEQELVIDPEYFVRVASREPRISHVQVLLKRGRAHNELTKYRYDVVLHVANPGPALVLEEWIDWEQAGRSVEALRQRLGAQPDRPLGVRRVPNARLHDDLSTVEAIAAADPDDRVAHLASDAQRAVPNVDPEALWALADELSYDATIGWSDSGPSGRFDVLFAPCGDASGAPGVAVTPLTRSSARPRERRSYATTPLLAKMTKRMVPELRDYIGEQLPDHMMPSSFVLLSALPLTPSGKVNREALPPPDFLRRGLSTAYEAPRTPVEERIVEIWSEILSVERLGVHDDFFELGGHSLLATQVISRMRTVFAQEVPLQALFDSPTVETLAAVIEGTQSDALAAPSIAHVKRADDPQLSFAQQRLWFIEQLYPEGTGYRSTMALRLHGRLDVEALRRSFDEVVRRHEVLRTTFRSVNGNPRQVIGRPSGAPFELVDLTPLPVGERDHEARRLALQEVKRAFDLSSGPLMRTKLLRLGERDHVLLVVLHHIVTDGWSFGVLKRELGALYAAFACGDVSPLAPLAVQYADFAAWQRSWMSGEVLEQQLDYWREKLAGVGKLQLPTDRSRPTRQTFEAAHVERVLPAELWGALEALSRREGATLFMTLLAAFAVLLRRYAGQDDVAVGSPIANRNRIEIEGLIGFFVNTLVMRTDLSGNPTFRELVSRVRSAALGAYQHQDVPFEKLVEELRPERDVSRNPLFQAVFAVQNAPDDDMALPDLEITRFDLGIGNTHFDLDLHIWERAQGSTARFIYNTVLFDAATIEQMAGHYRHLLDAIVADPDRRIDQLPILDEVERRQILVDWNDTGSSYPRASSLTELFEDQAARRPDAVAVEFEGEVLTYSELNRRANRVAHHLIRHGVGPEVKVGVALERSVEMVVGILGVLKAGGAYVPLDPDYPRSRLAYVLEDTRAPVLLTQDHLVPDLPEHDGAVVRLDADRQSIVEERGDNPVLRSSAEDLAYVMYTSGSTGRPKGSCIVHRSVVRLVRETNFIDVGPDDVFLQFAPISFDASTLELWGSLLNGAKLVVFPPKTPSLEELGRAIESHGVTTLWLTGALFQQMMDAQPDSFRKVRQLLAGGGALSVPHVRRIIEDLDGDRVLINGYGPTENTTFTCCHVMGPGSRFERSVPIGRPIANTKVYILDGRLEPVPLGAPGELYAAGDGLAREYLNDPGLTAEKLVPNPFGEEPDSRLYRTGDQAKYRPDGTIEFLGRIDNQVKVRGFRIELGEIETALIEHPAVRQAVVVCREDEPGEKLLVAYVVGAPGHELSRSELRKSLGDRLPDYMAPSAFVFLESLPITPNGKVDRRALPSPTAERQAEGVFVAPRSKLEERIAAIWCEVLDVEQVGVRDNFFDLGGHSLRLLQVHARLTEDQHLDVSITDLFQFPTVESLARQLSDGAEPGRSTLRDARHLVDRRRELAGCSGSIAIIGMAGRFPGAPDLDRFWSNLCQGVESIRFFEEGELRASGVSDGPIRDPRYVPAKGYLDDVDRFDAGFFGCTPREAEILDPQHRLFLECSWEALESAGYDPDRCGSRAGVYAGTGSNSYVRNVRSCPNLVESAGSFAVFTSSEKDFLATRVAYKLDLRGPAVCIQTACSTSLVAVHEACKSLLVGECNLALAGGVNVTVPVKAGYIHQERGILSRDGHCRSFDAEGTGTVGADGVGVVALKRLEDAVADGDRIHAVIKGSAINNDGSLKVGYTAPSVEGQAEVIATALCMAGVDPETVTYVETHGTATELGDPIEVAALSEVFGERAPSVQYCAIGSLKSNVGHLDAAAGVGGLIKTVLALKHRLIPPSLHYRTPNPQIDFANSPFFVNTELREWEPDGDGPLRAGVSSFGIGGTNAHVVVEEAPAVEVSDPAKPWQLLTLSARTASALERATDDLAAYLTGQPEINLADVANTLQVGRKEFAHRRVVVCEGVSDAADALESRDRKRVVDGVREPGEAPVVFMFTGQGTQYPNMALGLYRTETAFRSKVDNCCEILRGPLGLDLREMLFPPEGEEGSAKERLDRTEWTQPALFVIEYALARLWTSWGVMPSGMIGHGIGEYVAACLSGVMSLEDALGLVAERGRLMGELPGGSMLAVPLPEPELASELRDRGVEPRVLHTSHAFHSPMMDPIVEPFTERVREVALEPPRIRYVSNVTGRWITASEATDPEYWACHLRRAVRFSDGLETLFEDPERVLLEVGPGHTLASLARRHPSRPRDQAVVSSLRHPTDDRADEASMLEGLGRLWLAGVRADWSGLHAGERRHRVELPTYPFERQRYWIDSSGPAASPERLRRKPDARDWLYVPSWKPAPLSSLGKVPSESSWLLFTDGNGLGDRLTAELEQAGASVVRVAAGESFARESSDRYVVQPGQSADYARLFEFLAEEGKVPSGGVHLWSVTPDGESSARHLDTGFYSLLNLARALAGAGLDDALDLTVVTSAVQEVTGEEDLCPWKATALGICKVLGMELPEVRCRSIDVTWPATEDGLAALAADLARDVSDGSRDHVVAYRGRRRWVEGYEPVRVGLPDSGDGVPPGLREAGVYLITGGLGGVGLELASYLARQVRAKLVLVGRNVLPPAEQWDRWVAEHDEQDLTRRRIGRVRELQAAGAEVMVRGADVTDLSSMARVVSAAEVRFGPLHGVIHAAGVGNARTPIRDAAREDCERVFAPKVLGLPVLDEVVGDRELDFFLVHSSLSSAMGATETSAYTAAHLFMDAYTRQRSRTSRVPWRTVNWETWNTWKVEDRTYPPGVQEFMMMPDEFGDALTRLVSLTGVPQILVSTGDIEERIDHASGRRDPTFEDEIAGVERDALHPRPEIEAEYVAPRDEIERKLADLWERMLGIDRVGIHDNFFELGGDSVVELQIVAKANAAGLTLRAMDVFTHQTVAELAALSDGDDTQLDPAPPESLDRSEEAVTESSASPGYTAVGLSDSDLARIVRQVKKKDPVE